MQIKTRLVLLVASVAAVITATLATFYYTEKNINKARLEGRQAHLLVREVTELNSLSAEVNIADVSRVQHQWTIQESDVRAAIDALGSNGAAPTMFTELEQLSIAFKKMVDILEEEQRPDFSGNYTQARFYLWNHFSILLQSLVGMANQTANEAYEHVQQLQFQRNWFLSALAVVWVGSFLIWAYTLWQGFMGPLRGLLKALHVVGRGDLDYRAPVAGAGSDNEMNGLIRSFNSMMDRLQGLTVSRKSLIDATEQERARIGRELHDGICQTMAGARLQIGALSCSDKTCSKGLEELSNLLKETMVETRRIVKDLRPIMLDDLGLLATLEWLREQNRGTVELLLFSSVKEADIPKKLRTPMFRIVQEAFNNAVTHGRSKKIHVQISSENGGVNLSIEDEGQGFDLSKHPPGNGLVNIRERIAAEGGELFIDTAPGRGCCLHAFFPSAEES